MRYKLAAYLLAIIIALSITTVIADIKRPIILKTRFMRDISAKTIELSQDIDPEDILIIFDIDSALLKYKRLENHPANTEHYQRTLFEESTPRIIRNLQEKNFKTIALTSQASGKSADSESKNIAKLSEILRENRLNFSRSLRDITRVATFSNLDKHMGGYPMFYHGILTTNGNNVSKSKVIGTLLRNFERSYMKQQNFNKNKNQDITKNEDKVESNGNNDKIKDAPYMPKLIIVVDSDGRQLLDIGRYLQRFYPQVEFLGFRYDR